LPEAEDGVSKTVSKVARLIRAGERVLLLVGLTLIGVWAVARIHASVASHSAIERFQANAAANSDSPSSATGVDFSQWSDQRIAAYKESLKTKTDLPLAILRVPKINLEVPVFNDTDDLTLNRGVGRIIGTARIGEPGNLGIAGHRDGFFRGLKDVGPLDLIELVRGKSTDQYVVTNVQIVSPDDVHVLDPTPVPTLTLVTCYPFYFVGSAPQRYIVTAALKSSSQLDGSESKNSTSTGKKTNKKENEQ
jgi:sortase A